MTTVIDIWQGDSVELSEKLPDGINCVLTDPPYGMNYQSNMSTTPDGKKYAVPITNDVSVMEAIDVFDRVMDVVLPKTADTAELYVFTKHDIVDDWMVAVKKLIRHGFQYKMMLIWSKGDPGMGDLEGNWGCGHEIILYSKKGRRSTPRRRSSVLSVDKVPPTKIIHPTEKPVPLLEMLLKHSTDPGDLVVDPFSGSGSTMMACQRLGRNGIGIELSEEFVQRSRNRLENETTFELDFE